MNNGPNRPSGASGGGGRGKGRRHRRQQSKRGPGQQKKNRQDQRHGGIYTAPMDHSYRAALQGNSNGQGRNRGGRGRGPGIGSQYLQPDPEPLRVRDESAAPRIFVFVDDLFFLAKIQEVARKLNIKVEFVKTDKDILDRVEQNGEEKPSLIIVDLNNNSIRPLSLISKLKSKLKKETNIIGFLSHVQGDLKVKAQEAGCDMVLPRSAFSQNLPSLLRRHAVDEEEEVV